MVIHRLSAGVLPPKPHTALRGEGGALRHEHCLTWHGFDGPFSILYRLNAPHVHQRWERAEGFGWPVPAPGAVVDEDLTLRRHFHGDAVTQGGGSPLSTRVPLLYNADVVFGVLKPDVSDPVYFENSDGDDLYYIQEGGGTLRTPMGDVTFGERDYVFVPRGLTHRFVLEEGSRQFWAVFELPAGLKVPSQFRNPIGQLRMDAPYTHRDFRGPVFAGPSEEGIRTVVGKYRGRFTSYTLAHSPMDVVGWDGTIWPWAFNILDFQPKTSNIHLPPTIHGTFATRNGLICSFVPRLVDYHPQAIPCPYPHQSVDCDEILFYCEGNFTSRRGVGPGSVSFHPMGTIHGPHPGAYEGSIGHRETTELAVMMDLFTPLTPTAAAAAVEDGDYHASFIPAP